MPTAGRPEQPLDTTTGPLPRLAVELRRTRKGAGLTYPALAEKTGRSVTALRAAADGKHLPTWEVTCAFITACGGDEGTVRELWEDAWRAAGRQIPDNPPAEAPVPRPGEATSAPQLVDMMKHLRMWAGSPSLNKLNKLAGGHNLLPTSTVNDMLHSERLPRLDLMLTFVRACGLDDDQVTAWERAWADIKERELTLDRPAGQEPMSRSERVNVVFLAFLARVSGMSTEPTKHGRHADRKVYALGGGVLLTSLLAALSTAFAVHTAVAVPSPVAILLGIVWGVVVMSFDRILIPSVRLGEILPTLLAIVPRLLLGLLFGLVISTLVTMRIFAPEISAEVGAAHITSNSNFIKIDTQLVKANKKEGQAANNLKCELYGCGSTAAGSETQVVTAAKQYETAASSVQALYREFSQMVGEEQQQAGKESASAARAGLLARLDALEQIARYSAILVATEVLLFLLFAVLGCMPAIIWAVHAFDAKTTHSRIRETREKPQIPTRLGYVPPKKASQRP